MIVKLNVLCLIVVVVAATVAAAGSVASCKGLRPQPLSCIVALCEKDSEQCGRVRDEIR